MKKVAIFLLGTIILSMPTIFLFATEKIICKFIALAVIFVIVLSGPADERKFWKEYFKIIFPLPKEYDK